MEGDSPSLGLIGWVISVVLIFGNAFFVAAEYALVTSRRSRVETLAKQGKKAAQVLLSATQNLPQYVAGIQIWITFCSIGIGAITEAQLTAVLSTVLDPVAGRIVSVMVSLLIVTLILVVVGELVPKYIALEHPERSAVLLIRPLRFFVVMMAPLVWLVQRLGKAILLLFGIRMGGSTDMSVSKEELLLLVRAGGDEGMLEQTHSTMLQRALKFDVLDAADIMVHRLDIQWLDLETPRDEVLAKIGKIGHSRIPVCRGDIDEIEGVLYVQDLLRHWSDSDFDLRSLLRPVEAVPENLSINKIINRMRDAKSQIIIVMDEYGGTSGLITLEDVIEEVFGELEDQIESERPPIERVSTHRLSARAEVRLDELFDFLGVSTEGETETDTLAGVVQNQLGRLPKLGDRVTMPFGDVRVENMARRRITRVSIFLKPSS